MLETVGSKKVRVVGSFYISWCHFVGHVLVICLSACIGWWGLF
jgi:hypothetical protein